jgi:hypothetical protein
MRYCYHNRAYRNAGTPHGILCDPVRDEQGRCILSSRAQLVTFETGVTAVVIRRALRLRCKCAAHRDAAGSGSAAPPGSAALTSPPNCTGPEPTPS